MDEKLKKESTRKILKRVMGMDLFLREENKKKRLEEEKRRRNVIKEILKRKDLFDDF